ncbi:reverse transcriptase Ty1/copia-type domain-containing protein [Citrus sinensis]|uniref:Reverse transcriptase Ty1/copia-type domain-containing protein n=1 Tax=Citrus sinensis TaxID=2711 RepID=A0ACB8KJ49_CITSI|nr:reverse transcriptase Ty1/copia-type domain-containing protein [Citrus sinensis]
MAAVGSRAFVTISYQNKIKFYRVGLGGSKLILVIDLVSTNCTVAFAFALSAAHGIEVDEPKTYTEAVSSKDSKKWIAAMDEEMRSLIKNHTWDLIPKPTKKKVVGCKWIYKIKEGIPGVEPFRFKARLVAKGFTQKEGINFNEMDVKTAFLHGELEEMIVMAQPRGYENPDKADYVCHLKKSLYGLKQSPTQWYLRFDKSMAENSFQRCSYDCCVYHKDLRGGSKIYMLLYVDDMLIACKHMDQIDELKKQLKNAFEMKDLGAAKKILGVAFLRDSKKGILKLSQHCYIKKVLERFEMVDSKPVQTPLSSHFRLSCNQCPRTEDEKVEMSTIPYSSVVGCLMYAMVLTRPDISYAVSVVSKYMVNLGKEHWRAVKWILRYLSGTADYSLIYGAKRGTEVDVEGYVDADYAGDLDKRRLEMSRGVVKLLKIYTDNNIVDMLTKAIPVAKLEFCMNSAGIRRL